MKRADRNEPEFFETFWSLWREHMRKTDGKGKARPAYRKHILDGADPQDILDGAAYFLRTMSERDREFIPLAASWLNSERWADDCEKERAYRAKLEESRIRSQENVVQMPERRVKTAYMLSWERQHGKDYFEHFDEQKRRAGE